LTEDAIYGVSPTNDTNLWTVPVNELGINTGNLELSCFEFQGLAGLVSSFRVPGS
jgi:hypothetical protein